MQYQGGAGMELGNRVSGDGGGKSLNSMRNPYSPQISIQYNSETQRLVFEDNGIGINARDIEQYVAKIGVSFYSERGFFRTAASL